MFCHKNNNLKRKFYYPNKIQSKILTASGMCLKTRWRALMNAFKVVKIVVNHD